MKFPETLINKGIPRIPFEFQRNHMGDERGPP